MEAVRVWILPAFLTASALLLLATETRSIQAGLRERAPQWMRFHRRALGALTIAAIAFMVHFSKGLPTAATPEVDVYRQLQYWTWILVLAMVVILLAVWDALASIRALKRHLERVAREELQGLKDQLRSRQ